MIYRRARNLYWRLAKPDLHRASAATRARLREFVSKGDLVFDVGANVGDITALFLDIGARVVSVEPNPELAKLIRKRHGVIVEAAALGAEVGEAELQLGTHHEHSTLSKDYQTVYSGRFSGTVTVKVLTLDSLIAEYGEPAFVKIDVEGYESEVLRGLGHPVRALSFEFLRDVLDQTADSLAILDRLGSYSYRFSENAWPWSTPFSNPMTRDALLRSLEALGPSVYGDVYAERSDAPVVMA
jgi:FkbM family methyltransferase